MVASAISTNPLPGIAQSSVEMATATTIISPPIVGVFFFELCIA